KRQEGALGRRATGELAGLAAGSGGRGGIPDRHVHLVASLQEVRRPQDFQYAKVRGRLRPHPGAILQRGARLRAAAAERRYHRPEGARRDLVIANEARVIREPSSSEPPEEGLATAAAQEISQPPSGFDRGFDRLFRGTTLAVAWITVLLVAYIIWHI